MHTSAWSMPRLSRPFVVLILVAAALASGVIPPQVRAAAPSAAPMAPGSALASETPKTMCESVSDLRLYVRFLRDQSIEEDGLLPMLVGSVASISEAHTLVGLVNDAYRPLVVDLIASLEDLQTAVRGFRDQATVGSGLVQLGVAISRVGAAMEALSAAISEPCPVEAPGPSGLPAVSPSPIA